MGVKLDFLWEEFITDCVWKQSVEGNIHT